MRWVRGNQNVCGEAMSFESNVAAVRQLMDSNQLEPFVRHIRFPFYRNLEPDSRIDFLFPFTAIVGMNGTNKSSILRAIQSTPGQSSLGLYWFSTSTDSISDRGDDKPCFIYGYHHTGAKKVVEVLKTRVQKVGDPDYWEPSRRQRRYQMERFDKTATQNRAATRWDAIAKPVVYIDFRQTLSAFDRRFFYGPEGSYQERKEKIRRRSPMLQQALTGHLQSHVWHRKERIHENRLLTTAEVKAASFILGRPYSEIRWIRHTFFDLPGATCRLKTPDLAYTEAFAGSGEFAVVRLVSDILLAKPKSLILLDEPEVSLHPGAQDRLVQFLFEQIKLKKHQVVVSTHSPGIIRHLPPEAIKVMMVDPATGQNTIPAQSTPANEAFFHIGEPQGGKLLIVVEDVLALHIVQRALSIDEAFANQFAVRHFPGGAETVWGYYVPVFGAEDRSDVTIMLDGDKRPQSGLPDPSAFSDDDLNKLRAKLDEAAGTSIRINVDGGASGGNQAQMNAMLRATAKWALKHLHFMKFETAEQFVWQEMVKVGNEPPIANQDYKKGFEELTRQDMGLKSFQPLDSSDILQTQRRRLATIATDHPVFKQIETVARAALETKK